MLLLLRSVFTATSNPVYVEFSKPKKAKAKTSLVLALLRSGSVGLWQFDRKADADAKPTSHKPDSVIKIVLGGEADSKKKKGKPGSVLFAQFTNEHEVLVAFGTTTKPIFERVVCLFSRVCVRACACARVRVLNTPNSSTCCTCRTCWTKSQGS